MLRHKRRSSREMKQELRSIYTRNGAIPDLSRLERSKRSSVTRLLLKLIVILGLLSALAWGGFFLFTQGLFQEDEALTVEIEGPSEVKSGEKVTYKIQYENSGAVPIANLAVKLNIPESFHVLDSIPESQQTGEWDIGSLSEGSDGSITLTGIFLSEVPSSQRLQVLSTYKPANFSSDFQTIATHKVEIQDSVVALSFSGPQKALAGDASEFVINVQNTGSEPIFNLRVVPNLSPNLTISKSEPALSAQETFWRIDALEPGELSAISFTGIFTSSASGEQKSVATVGFVDDDLFLPQASQEIVTDVLGGSVAFSTIINGSSQNQTASLGETLRISLDYSNASEQTIQDLEFELKVEGTDGTVPIDWSAANLGKGTRSGNTIIWDSSTLKALASLASQEKGVIDLSLPIVSKLSSDHAQVFTILTTLTIGKIGEVASTRTLTTTPITISLNSDLALSAEARYFSETGVPIGSGPHPPRVGESTSYRVYWNLSNSLHALGNLKMTTTIPQDVTWLSHTDTDIGTLSYDATTRLVTWTINKLPVDVKHAGAWFDLSIHPQKSDIGRFLKLTNTTNMEAQDTVTNTSIHASMDALTTELPDDEFATGNGVVVK